MASDHPRQGSFLLVIIALVAVAGMVAYGFVLGVRQTQISAEKAIAGDLAQVAARMGARHALEVLVAQHVGPVMQALPEGPQRRDFDHTDRFTSTNLAPCGGASNLFDLGDDNVRPDARLYYLHHDWNGSLDNQDWSLGYTAKGYWPFCWGAPTQNEGDGVSTPNAALFTGMPRWIEACYWDPAGSVLRFGSVPASAPGIADPLWFDQRWRPVASRTEARYRLRYALEVLDLGGHLAWGRQSGWDPGRPVSDPLGNALEWDADLAGRWMPSLTSMAAKRGIAWLNAGYGNRQDLASVQAQFAGRGSAAQAGDGQWMPPGSLLPGFAADGRAQPWSAFGFTSAPGFLPPQPQRELMQNVVGGPWSWSVAQANSLVGGGMGWLNRWNLTPFARTTQRSAAPALPHESLSDCPWRINILTAPGETVRAMLFGYMPHAALKFPITKQSWYAFDRIIDHPWPTPDEMAWNPAPYQVDVFNPPRASTPHTNAPDLHSRVFAPASAEGAILFDFASPDFSAPMAATTYDEAYPGPPADWEDYAAFELGTADRYGATWGIGEFQSGPPNLSGAPGSAPAAPVGNQDVHKLMLGTLVNIHKRVPKRNAAGAPDRTSRMQAQRYHPSSGEFFVSPYFTPVPPSPWGASVQFVWSAWYGLTLSEPARGHAGELLALGGSNYGFIAGNQDKVDIEVGGGWGGETTFHQESYWLDLVSSLANTVAVAKAVHMNASLAPHLGTFATAYHNRETPAGRSPAPDGTTWPWPTQAVPMRIADLDRIYLAGLGEWYPGDLAGARWPGERRGSDPADTPGSTPATVAQGWTVFSCSYWQGDTRRTQEVMTASPRYLMNWYPFGHTPGRPGQPPGNIRGTYQFLITPSPAGPGLTSDQARRKVANMERVLNDTRMSFFGANPAYAGFRPFDFDGDGWACCSGYTGSQHPLPLSNGKRIPAATAVNGVGSRAPDRWFSLTGYFTLDKIRFARALVRGQVWDELRSQPAAEANLETVFAIDPDGDGGAGNPGGLRDTCTLYTRWLENRYPGGRARTVE